MRTYQIILITHCDDCETSNRVARVRPSRGWQYGPRCSCGQQTGPMQWVWLASVRANGQFEALRKYDETKRKYILKSMLYFNLNPAVAGSCRLRIGHELRVGHDRLNKPIRELSTDSNIDFSVKEKILLPVYRQIDTLIDKIDDLIESQFLDFEMLHIGDA